jgi:hypothetical protein
MTAARDYVMRIDPEDMPSAYAFYNSYFTFDPDMVPGIRTRLASVARARCLRKAGREGCARSRGGED